MMAASTGLRTTPCWRLMAIANFVGIVGRWVHHLTDACCKFVQTVIFCSCCETRGDHLTEDCPREANDGRKYCGICDWLGDHLTEHCPLAESEATASRSFTPSKM